MSTDKVSGPDNTSAVERVERCVRHSGELRNGEYVEYVPASEARDLARQIDELRAELSRVERLVYVPGVWSCARCGLRIVETTIHVDSGRFSANNEPKRCANGCGSMWRVTERDAGNRMCDRYEELRAQLASEVRGSELAHEQCNDLRAASEATRKENTILRGLIQHNPSWKCTYGNLDHTGQPLKSMAQCPQGFPGCGCADDLMCGAEEINRSLRAENERLKAEETERHDPGEYVLVPKRKTE